MSASGHIPAASQRGDRDDIDPFADGSFPGSPVQKPVIPLAANFGRYGNPGAMSALSSGRAQLPNVRADIRGPWDRVAGAAGAAFGYHPSQEVAKSLRESP
jgi:hypothetical protein